MEYEDKMKKMDEYIKTVLNTKITNGILMQEAIGTNDMELFDLCVDHEKNLPLENGTLPILYAAKLGRTEMVAKLLDRGVDIDTVYTTVVPAVFTAISGNHLDTARLLIARGANLNVGLISNIVNCIVNEKENLTETMTLLLDAGFDLNRTENVHHPLFSLGQKLIARSECSLDIIKMMFARGFHFWSVHLRFDDFDRFRACMVTLLRFCQSEDDVEYIFAKSREFNRIESFTQAFFSVMVEKMIANEEWANFEYILNIVKQLPNDYSVLRHSFSFISSFSSSTRRFLNYLAERLDSFGDRSIKCDHDFIPLSDVCMGFYKKGDVEAVTSFFKRLHERGLRFGAKHVERLLCELVLDG